MEKQRLKPMVGFVSFVFFCGNQSWKSLSEKSDVLRESSEQHNRKWSNK